MSTPSPTRRLAAVLLADVAGYSRMMERDEAGTHMRLREVRVTVTDPAIERHHGRVVRSKGDDLLVEFASATEALACAIDIQRQMAEHNRGLSADSRIEFRIGINLGDILIDGPDIAGDGVNVAARLEALAEPGGIAISSAVREQVRQLVGARLSDLGSHRVKNISRPIRVFRVRLDESDSHAASFLDGLRRRAWPAALVTTLLAALATAVWLAPWHMLVQPDLPRQSIALLPVANASGDPRLDGFAAELTQRMASATTQAMGVAGRVVQARSSNGAADLRDLGRSLGVRYVATTTLTTAGPPLRLAVSLVSAESGKQVWNAFVEAVRDGADDLPLELIGRVADGLAAETRAAELARTPMPDPPDAAWLALRARALLPTTATAEALREVRTLYEQALQRERDYVPALNGLALSLAYETDRTTDPQAIAALLKQADEASLRAIGAAPGDAETWRTRALVAQVQGQLTSATEAIERALMLNPYSSDSHSQHGVVLTATGRAQEAVAAFDRAIRINPGADNIGVYLYFRARALLYLGRYDEAIESCNRALAYTPDWPDFMVLAAAYAMKGDREQAARARSELLRREPDFRISWMLDDGVMQPHARQQRNEHLIAGLRRAGLPE